MFESLGYRIFFSQANGYEQAGMEDLGFLPIQADMIDREHRKSHGAVFVSGPTGSGVSTTLRAIVRMVLKQTNGQSCITTIGGISEMPVSASEVFTSGEEFTPKIRWQAGTDAVTEVSGPGSHALLIGDSRNGEEIGILLAAVRRGHRCLSPLHANTALGIGTRLRNAGGAEEDLRDPTVIHVLIVQRLLPWLCQKCKISVQEKPLERSTDTRIRNVFRCDPGLVDHFFQENKAGCASCDYRGWVGRKMASEVVVPDAKVLDTLFNHGEQAAKEYWLKYLDGFTFAEHALVHLLNGDVDVHAIETKVGYLPSIEKDCLDIIKFYAKAVSGLPVRKAEKRVSPVFESGHSI